VDDASFAMLAGPQVVLYVGFRLSRCLTNISHCLVCSISCHLCYEGMAA